MTSGCLLFVLVLAALAALVLLVESELAELLLDEVTDRAAGRFRGRRLLRGLRRLRRSRGLFSRARRRRLTYAHRQREPPILRVDVRDLRVELVADLERRRLSRFVLRLD